MSDKPWGMWESWLVGTHVRSPGNHAASLQAGWRCEGDLKFELLVFLAAPAAVLRLSFPFLLLERKRNRLEQVQPPTDPQNKEWTA